MTDLKRLSRFLSLMLRHKADQFGLELDSNGFTELDAVWAQVERKYGSRYTRVDLNALMANTARFEISDGRIRALYGHNKAVTGIQYPPAEPPQILYHGTVESALESIKSDGLKSLGRQYVHLSTTPDRAAEVAQRRGTPVMLKIRAQDAYTAGIVFHHPEPKHYLTPFLPAAFIEFPDESE